MWAWWQNLTLVHNFALFCQIFDTYVDSGSTLVKKFKLLDFKNWENFGVKSPCVRNSAQRKDLQYKWFSVESSQGRYHSKSELD